MDDVFNQHTILYRQKWNAPFYLPTGLPRDPGGPTPEPTTEPTAAPGGTFPLQNLIEIPS